MSESKLGLLLKSLSKEELREFDKFVQSPFFNTNPKVTDLFFFIRDEENAFSNGMPDKRKVYRFLFPGKPYKDLHCRQYLSSLTTLIEQFLEISRMQQEQTLLKQSLMEEMIDRSSEKLFNQAYLKANRQNGFQNGKHFLNQFTLEDIRNRFLAHFAQRQNRFIAQPDYHKALQNLDSFYLIYKLKYCCELLNYKTIGAVEQETILLDEILDLLSKKDYSDIPAINIYYKVLLTLTEPENESNYTDLLNTLKENDHLFPQEETREMYIYAQNFCIRQINKGKTKYLHELLAIYKLLLAREIILQKGELSPWDYKNIVVTALRCEDFDWVGSFIHRYKTHLPAGERDNAFTYNLAKFHFYKKQYDQVLQLLQKVEYKDVFYSLDSKAMLLKTYYELDELESLYSLMDSFKVFLRRKKALSEHHIKTYKNLIKITKKLSKSIPGDKKRAIALAQEIEKTKPLADINWLKEKVKELK